MQKSSNNHPSGKSPTETHQSDIFSSTLQETANKGYYQEAQQELAPVPYAQRNRNLYLFSKGFTTIYHVVSFVLGIATVVLIAKAFHTGEASLMGILIAILVALLLVGLLIGLELLKSLSATNLFKILSKGEKPTTGSKMGLTTAFVFSIIISAIGGAFLSIELNDKSKEIQSILLTESDSLKTIYQPQLDGF